MVKKLGSLVILVVILSCGSLARAEAWGTLSGQFIYGADAPKSEAIVVTKDVAMCGGKGLVKESLVVNSENKGIANIVVYMYLKSSDPKPPVHESYAETATEKVHFDNLNCRFEPHVVGMRTTQTLVIGNKDPDGHNTKGDCLSNDSFNPLIPGNGSLEMQLPKSERLPVTVSCNIHPWMKGFLVVKDNPYFAITDKDGKFEIKNVPAGEWVFQVWHEESGYVDDVIVGGSATKWKKGRVDVNVTASGTDLGKITVPPATFDD